MSGYFGTDLQEKLQRRTFERRQEIVATPGLYNGGRFIGTDDPDKVGWSVLHDLLQQQHGVLPFRLITPEQSRTYFPRLVELGCRIDTWDVFIADAQSARPVVDAILRTRLPDGIVLRGPLSHPEGEDTIRVQQFLADNAVAPLPGSMLVEGRDQATVVLIDQHGAPVAVANTHLPHNIHSPHHKSAWVGLIAVAPPMRGAGLGRYVNALAIKRALEELGAERVYELVSSSNEPSRRMVQSCGLTVVPDLMVGVAVPAEAAKVHEVTPSPCPFGT